jgi:hypothetical protein
MPNEHSTGMRIAGERPPIPVRTAVNLSGPNGHALLHAPPQLYRSRERNATPAVKRGPFQATPNPAFATGLTAAAEGASSVDLIEPRPAERHRAVERSHAHLAWQPQ